MTTRAIARQVREEMEVALAQIAAKHGLTVEIGRMTYGVSGLRMRVEMPSTQAAQWQEITTVLNAQRKAGTTDLFPVGAMFHLRETTYTITGLRKAKKNIYELRTNNGRQVVGSHELLSKLARVG